MKTLLIAAAVLLVLFMIRQMFAGPGLDPGEVLARMNSGRALLIDVREPAEWRGGVVSKAVLLPLSDLQGSREKWKPVLESVGDRQIIVYCRSGNRSGIALNILRSEGFDVVNAGGFGALKAAGLPVVKP